MQYYYEYLKKTKYKVIYINFKQKLPNLDFTMFDPIDKIKLPKSIKILSSPNFLLSDYQEYRKKTDKFFFNNFYHWGKKKLI